MPEQQHTTDDTLAQLERTWETLGRDDPLWAVVSHADKRGGRWQLEEFLATGEADVRRICVLLERVAGVHPPFGQVLDFGCGVGRLVKAWSVLAATVTGVDISRPMLECGAHILRGLDNVHLRHNGRRDLKLFPDSSFDLVVSLICLQHMPWPVAAGYLHEFSRVCRPGGLVVFQLPSRRLHSSFASRLRRFLVDSLPFGLGDRYRRWRHGTGAVFEMYFTASTEVERTCLRSGLRLVHREADSSAGPGTESFLYFFIQPPRS